LVRLVKHDLEQILVTECVHLVFDSDADTDRLKVEILGHCAKLLAHLDGLDLLGLKVEIIEHVGAVLLQLLDLERAHDSAHTLRLDGEGSLDLGQVVVILNLNIRDA
jgi:hypothetical protein